MNQLVLLGDVGQVEELVERPRHRQQFVFLNWLRLALSSASITTAVGLGALADLLDLVEELIAVLVSNGVAQQLTQQVNILAQACIDRSLINLQPEIRDAQACRVPPVSVYDKTLNLVVYS
jgi:hypothetical protein